MVHRFEPSVGRIVRRWGWSSPVAGGIVGLGVLSGVDGASAATAVGWGLATVVVGLGGVTLRDYWLRFWTIEVSARGVRAVSPRAEHEVTWSEISALDESYHGGSWTVEWGGDDIFAPQSFTISLNAYPADDASRLVALLRAGVKRPGVVTFCGASAPSPSR